MNLGSRIQNIYDDEDPILSLRHFTFLCGRLCGAAGFAQRDLSSSHDVQQTGGVRYQSCRALAGEALDRNLRAAPAHRIGRQALFSQS